MDLVLTRNEGKIAKWKTIEAIAQFYILRSAEIHLKFHFLMCTTSNKMYKTPVAVFSRDTEEPKYQLLTEFHNVKFDSSEDILSNKQNKAMIKAMSMKQW